MSNNLCAWCHAREGNTWNVKINNQSHNSKEKFCSLKCKTEYEDRFSITWEKKTSTNWLGLIILGVILYFLLK